MVSRYTTITVIHTTQYLIDVDRGGRRKNPIVTRLRPPDCCYTTERGDKLECGLDRNHTDRQSDVGMNEGGLRQQQKGPSHPPSFSGLTGSLEDENEAESDSIPSPIHVCARHRRHGISFFPFTFLRHCGDLVRQASY